MTQINHPVKADAIAALMLSSGVPHVTSITSSHITTTLTATVSELAVAPQGPLTGSATACTWRDRDHVIAGSKFQLSVPPSRLAQALKLSSLQPSQRQTQENTRKSASFFSASKSLSSTMFQCQCSFFSSGLVFSAKL